MASERRNRLLLAGLVVILVATLFRAWTAVPSNRTDIGSSPGHGAPSGLAGGDH